MISVFCLLPFLELFFVDGGFPSVAFAVDGSFPSGFCLVFVGGIVLFPPFRVFSYSSSVMRSAYVSSGKDGCPRSSSSSGTSLTTGFYLGSSSQFLFLSVE
jgi:hypothetical protein